MNIKEYIASGVIESYVLGLSSAEERAEFDKLCQQYPELITARTDFEIALEQQLLSQASVPAGEVKEKVMGAVRQQSFVNQTKVITMESTNTNRGSSSLRWVAAAAVILLLAAAYFAFSFYSKNKDLEAKLAGAKNEEGKKTDEVQKLNQDLNIEKMVTDPNVAVVSLKATEKAPKSAANIYWDTTASNVYLVVKNMPKLATDKQYQLWSIINGPGGKLEPTSLGLFDVGEDGKIILKMDGTKKADAFAITIETKGNTGGPNLEQLQTMGKTSL